MSGGVAPWEYFVPPLALAHTAYNTGAKHFGPNAKLNAPGSKNAIQNRKEADQRSQLGDAQAEMARRADELRYNTTPQTAAEAYASRLRAQKARQELGAGGRASDYLTSTLGL